MVTEYFAVVGSLVTPEVAVEAVAPAAGAVIFNETDVISEDVSGKVNLRVNVAPPLGISRFSVTAVLFTFTLLLDISDLKVDPVFAVSVIFAVYAFPAAKVAVEFILVWPSYHSRVVTEYFADVSGVTRVVAVDAVSPTSGASIVKETDEISAEVAGKVNLRVNVAPPLGMSGLSPSTVLFTLTSFLVIPDLK